MRLCEIVGLVGYALGGLPGERLLDRLGITERVGIGAETVSRWLNAPEFPERRIRTDRRRDQALFLQSRKRGLQPSLTRTHYSAGRVAALLNMPSHCQRRRRDI
jgi:hypothetical protein